MKLKIIAAAVTAMALTSVSSILVMDELAYQTEVERIKKVDAELLELCIEEKMGPLLGLDRHLAVHFCEGWVKEMKKPERRKYM